MLGLHDGRDRSGSDRGVQALYSPWDTLCVGVFVYSLCSVDAGSTRVEYKETRSDNNALIHRAAEAERTIIIARW